jgi:hypothetical protein
MVLALARVMLAATGEVVISHSPSRLKFSRGKIPVLLAAMIKTPENVEV